MHLSRIEGATGTTSAVPGDDVVAAIGTVADTIDARIGATADMATSTPVRGCFNAGVSRMLTHWKEN